SGIANTFRLEADSEKTLIQKIIRYKKPPLKFDIDDLAHKVEVAYNNDDLSSIHWEELHVFCKIFKLGSCGTKDQLTAKIVSYFKSKQRPLKKNEVIDSFKMETNLLQSNDHSRDSTRNSEAQLPFPVKDSNL